MIQIVEEINYWNIPDTISHICLLRALIISWSPLMVEVSRISQLTSISVMGCILLISKSELYFLYNFVNPDLHHKRNKSECKQVKWWRSLSLDREFDPNCIIQGECSSILVMSDFLRPHGLQHTRPPCSSPIPRVYSNSSSIESVMPSKHLILCCPILLLPSIFPSIRVFSNYSVLRIRWPKYWNFSFSISPSNE